MIVIHPAGSAREKKNWKVRTRVERKYTRRTHRPSKVTANFFPLAFSFGRETRKRERERERESSRNYGTRAVNFYGAFPAGFLLLLHESASLLSVKRDSACVSGIVELWTCNARLACCARASSLLRARVGAAVSRSTTGKRVFAMRGDRAGVLNSECSHMLPVLVVGEFWWTNCWEIFTYR